MLYNHVSTIYHVKLVNNEICIGIWNVGKRLNQSLRILTGVGMDEEDEAKLREREAAILKARENISEETLREYKEIFSFFDRLNVCWEHDIQELI